MAHGMEQQKAGGAVGLLAAAALQPGAGRGRARTRLQPRLQAPTLPLKKYIYNETPLHHAGPEPTRRRPRELLRLAEQDVRDRWNLYEQLAAIASGTWP